MCKFRLPILGLVSHKQRVKTLYKKALRNLRAYYSEIYVYRYDATLLRARFDKHKYITDLRKAKQLVKDGEEELFMWGHYCPLKFPMSVGGVAFERVVPAPDWVLDYWHPLEKLQYPEYFARREERKAAYIEAWDKMYGDKAQDDPDDNGEEICCEEEEICCKEDDDSNDDGCCK